MEPPPPTPPPLSATVAPPNTAYADSVDSSPRSRNADTWDDQPFSSLPSGASAKLRLMCSYGGHIVPRPHDKSLCYVGGDTRIVVADRHSSLSDLTARLSKSLRSSSSFSIKYQLPNEDLDSLISVTTDEDLENMVEEYDRLNTQKSSSRLRVFLFGSKPDSCSSIGSLLENSTKSEDWFLNALNGGGATSTAGGGFSESASVNSLLGLDDDVVPIAGNENSSVSVKKQEVVHSVPDSPMLETTSSFGSTSSSPLLANLPPIRVHVGDQRAAAVAGIEEQFSQVSVAGGGAVAEPPQLQPLPQAKPSGGVDLVSPDSVSSDGSITNPLSRQRAMMYQDSVVQNPSGNNRVPVYPVDPKLSDPNSRVQNFQMQQQVQDSGYVLSTQFDQQQQLIQQQQQLIQQQQQHQQQQQQQQQHQQQQQQFIQDGTHYIQHHPTGAVPLTSYYPMYPPQQQPLHPQQQLDQHYPVYYVSARQAQGYSLPVQQSNYSETTATTGPSNRPQMPPPSSMNPPSAAYNTARNAPAPKPEMAAGMYRTATAAGPQYVGFSQIHHPSQSIAPTSAATANYAYEFADPAHAQMYYAQPMAAQYQTMTSAHAVVLPEASAQLPTDNNMKQQIRTLQP